MFGAVGQSAVAKTPDGGVSTDLGAPASVSPEPDQPLAARVNLFIGQRARILEQMTPTWRAARIHEPFSEQLQRHKPRCSRRPRRSWRRSSRAELAELEPGQRQQLAGSLHAISIWSFWESLSTELGLGPAQASDLVGSTFSALLFAAGIR